MVIIFSFSGDLTTNLLVDWLSYYNVEFSRIHLQDEKFNNIKIYKNEKDNLKLNTKLVLASGRTFNFSDISFFIFRGGKFYKNHISKLNNDTVLTEDILDLYNDKEFTSFVNFFYGEINLKSIGYCFNQDLNKLHQLNLALNNQLKVPNFIISNKKKEVRNFFNNSKGVITKSIQENIAFDSIEAFYLSRVQEVVFNELEDEFFPSFFQEKIDKEYEVRIFYLDGKCYSVSLLTNNETVDMRDNYHNMQYEPYKLPESIEVKIQNFMHQLNLISGSIDMLRSKEGEYYFLEVNPEGQYDWVSVYGGYDLHHEVVKFLLKKETEFNEKKKQSDLL